MLLRFLSSGMVLPLFFVSACEFAHAQCTAAPTREYGPFKPTNPTKPPLRDPLLPSASGSLQIVALGDSVVWGNGDKPEHKFVEIVATRLAESSQREVTVEMFAHSGARLKKTDDNPTTVPSENGVPLGDLNGQLPTTEQQENCAATNYSKAEVVLVDGCINEVSAEKIALPFPFSRTTPEKIRKDVDAYCSVPMRDVLSRIKSDFPNATIIVLNYYRIISDESKPLLQTTPGQRKPSLAAKGSSPKEVDKLIVEQMKIERLAGTEHLHVEQTQALTKKSWGDNSDAFLTSSRNCFDWAIAQVNRNSEDAPGGDTVMGCPPATDHQQPRQATPNVRVYLATVPDDATYAYGAPNSHLWKLPIHFLWWTWGADEMYADRKKICERTYPEVPWAKETCEIDAIAHPNIEGAAAYAENITKVMSVAWSPTP